tara:strand:+ start:6215 stop:6724 length:510 start_codon:yes stop_codon:yes gene_type:complete
MKIRDRIKELRRVNASELMPNPKNWRTHPVGQQDALKSVLSQIGYADAVIARETKDGLMLIDGHLRAETTPDATIPVLVLDINEEEADLLLATLDPLAGMAEPNTELLKQLLEGIDDSDDHITALIQGVKDMNQIIDYNPEPPTDWNDYDDETIKTNNTCPKCGYEWNE